MTLSLKGMLAICVLFSVMISALYLGCGDILFKSYDKLEKQELQESFRRVQEIIAGDLEMLATQVGDWSSWDDAYEFVENGNAQFIVKNISPNSFKELKVNLILFVNTSGRIVYEGWYDTRSGEVSGGKVSIRAHLGTESRLLNHSVPSSSATGVLNLAEGPLLVAARPILSTNRIGPIRGTLIMGRLFDDIAMARLSRESMVKFSIARMGDPYMSPEFTAVQGSLTAATPQLEKTFGGDELVLYGMLKDLYGKNSFIIKTCIQRDTTKEGNRATRSVQFLILAAGAGGAVLLALLLQILCFSGISALNKPVSSVGSDGTGEEERGNIPLSRDDGSGGGGAIVNETPQTLKTGDKGGAGPDIGRLQRFFDEAPTGLYVADPDGTVRSCNAALAHSLGYDTPAEAVAATHAALIPEGVPMAELVATLQKRNKIIGQAVDMVCRSGMHLPTIQNLSAVKGPTGDLVQIEGYILAYSEPVNAPVEPAKADVQGAESTAVAAGPGETSGDMTTAGNDGDLQEVEQDKEG